MLAETLEAEFMESIWRAKHKRLEPWLGSLALSNRVQWGFTRVTYWGRERAFYEPQPDGTSFAIIAPIVESGELVDLAAIRLPGQHIGRRVGVGRGLGLDAVEKARCRCCDLGLVASPLDWLRDPVDNAYLFDLSDAAVALDGVGEITCASIELADRVRAFMPPSRHASILATAMP
jgi:hypothetical protein